MKLFLTLLLLPTFAHSFRLNNSIGARFKNNNVEVRVGINPTPCANVDLDEVSGLIDEAMDDFWNTIPTSRLNLKSARAENTGDDNFLTGELCLIGGACGGTPVPATSDIIITCNNNATNFPGGGSLLALTLPNVISGKNIKGGVVLINDTNDSFGSLSRSKKIAVIAHEVGHAIGLGHSEENSALMYYEVVPSRKSLGRDDILGVTYLYPEQDDMYGVGCFLGSIAVVSGGSDDDSNGPGTFWPTAILGLLLAFIFKPKSKKESAESSLA